MPAAIGQHPLKAMSELTTPYTERACGLEIQRQADARGVVLLLYGELDLASAPELSRELEELQVAGSGRLVIDLGGVTFMDSTGLTLLLRAHESAQTNGHQLALRRGSNQVQRLFELTGALERFTFEDPPAG